MEGWVQNVLKHFIVLAIFLFSLQKYSLGDIFNLAVSGLNGAEIVFTPCATTGRINESTWGIEVRIFYLLSLFSFCLKQPLTDFLKKKSLEGTERGDCQQLFHLRCQQGRHRNLSKVTSWVSHIGNILFYHCYHCNLCHPENSAAATSLRAPPGKSSVSFTAPAMSPPLMEVVLL